MARADFAEQAALDRSLQLTDHIGGFRPGAATAEESVVTDTVAALGTLIGSGAGAAIEDSGNSTEGLFVQYGGADASWHLRGRARAAGSIATPAELSFDNQDQDASLDVSLPVDWIASPTTQNGAAIVYSRHAAPRDEVKAFYDYDSLRITSARTGVAGDLDRIAVEAGTEEVVGTNSTASIALSTGTIDVASPDAAFLGTFGSGTYGPSDGSTVNVNIRAAVRGRDAGNVTFIWRTLYDPDLTGLEIQITRPNPNSVSRRITIASNTETVDLDWNLVVTAFNDYREGGDAIFVATIGDTTETTLRLRGETFNPLLVDSRSINRYNPAYATNASLSFGDDPSSGSGAATNVGEVRVTRGGTRVAGVKASATTRALTVRWNVAGTVGNGKTAQRVGDNTFAANVVTATQSGDTLVVRGPASGTVSVGTIVDAINNANLDDWEAVTSDRNDTITFPANGSTFMETTAGGVDAANQLEVTWDADIHQLHINNVVPTDRAAGIVTAIVALDEFDATDVTYGGGGSGTSALTIPANEDDFTDYNFSGGVGGSPRSTLTVAESVVSSTSNLLTISGILNTDTVQNVIDAYSGSGFTLGATPGDSASDALPGTAIPERALANGLDEIVRQDVTVAMADNGVITISLHAVDDDSDNSTLTELYNAFLNTPYTDADGTEQMLAAGRLTLDTSGGGAGGDPLRNQTLPVMPSGGVDEVAAGDIEASIVTDPALGGPYVQVQYLPAQDTLADIRTALNEQGIVKASTIYGTTLGNTPEAVPFERSMHTGGESATTTSEAAQGIAFLRSANDLNEGLRIHHAQADHTWALVTVAGTQQTAASVGNTVFTGGSVNTGLRIEMPELFAHGTAGNDWFITLRTGNAARMIQPIAAFAHLALASPGHGITVTNDTPGPSGDGFEVQVVVENYGTTPRASYTSATHMRLVLSRSDDMSDVLTAINDARYEGNKIVTATLWNALATYRTGNSIEATHRLAGGANGGQVQRDPLQVSYDGGTDNKIVITLRQGDLLSDIKDALEAWHYHGQTPFDGLVTQTGGNTVAVNAGIVENTVGDENDLAFSGGVNAGAVTAVADSSEKTVTLTYAAVHTLNDLIAVSTNNIEIAAIANTDTLLKPENAGVIRSFDFDETGIAEVEEGLSVVHHDGTLEGSGTETSRLSAQGIQDDVDDLEADVALLDSITRNKDLTSNLDPTFEVVGFGAFFAAMNNNFITLSSNAIDIRVTTATAFYPRVQMLAVGDVVTLVSGTTELVARIDAITFTDASRQGSLSVTYLKGAYTDIAEGATGVHILAQGIDDAAIGSKALRNVPSDLSTAEQNTARTRLGILAAGGATSVTVTFWQDASETSAEPSNAMTKSVALDRGLFVLDFPAIDGNRYIHLSIPIAYELNTVAITNRGALNRFTIVEGTSDRVYHSQRVSNNSQLDLLVEATTA